MQKQQKKKIFLFGIGAQKAGTTWLYAQLIKQEGVFFAQPKELHYWDCIRSPYLERFKINAKKRLHVPTPGASLRYHLSRFWRADLRDRIKLAERYEAIYNSSLFDHSAYKAYSGLDLPGVRLAGDITPSYALLSRDTYAEMLAFANDVRFVFIMRDPVRRLWSGIHQQFRSQLANGSVTHEELARLFESICKNPLDPNFLRSDYPRTIKELEAAVPQARIHYCFFESLFDTANGAEERRKLAEFVDLPASSLTAQEKIHANKNVNEINSKSEVIAQEEMHSIYKLIKERFGSRVPTSWGF